MSTSNGSSLVWNTAAVCIVAICLYTLFSGGKSPADSGAGDYSRQYTVCFGDTNNYTCVESPFVHIRANDYAFMDVNTGKQYLEHRSDIVKIIKGNDRETTAGRHIFIN